MSALRRYEILLPKRFNTGGTVPEELFADTAAELRERFGAVSWETQIIRGEWEYQGMVFRDEMVRLLVDAPRAIDAEQFFVELKERLKTRFQQIDIWITAFDLNSI